MRRIAHRDAFVIRNESLTGTEKYVATDDLKIAVNAAIALERPLLIKGEPGTGKTVLAYEVAEALDAPLITGTSSPPPRPSRGFTNTTP